MLPPGPSSLAGEILPDYDRLKNFFQREVGCHHEAQDLTQETFLRILGRAGNAPESPKKMLFRIARNLLIDRFRSSSAVRFEALSEHLEDSRESAVAAKIEAKEQLEAVREAMLKLTPRCRRIFVMHRFEKKSYAEIAEAFGISVHVVGKEIMRAVLACRDAVDRGESRQP